MTAPAIIELATIAIVAHNIDHPGLFSACRDQFCREFRIDLAELIGTDATLALIAQGGTK